MISGQSYTYALCSHCTVHAPMERNPVDTATSRQPNALQWKSHLYIPRIGPHISCSRIGRSIVGMYQSFTDTWMWKLGLWPRNPFLGIFVSNFRYWFFAEDLSCITWWSGLGVLNEPSSAKPAQRSCRTGLPGYIGCLDTVPAYSM
jgi:hypothetical protein